MLEIDARTAQIGNFLQACSLRLLSFFLHSEPDAEYVEDWDVGM